MPGLADTSCQWDCRGFGVCRGMGFRDAVVNPVATSLQTRMGLGVGVPPWNVIPGRRCCPVATSLMFSPWVRGSAVGLVFRVKRTVHFAELGLPASGETFNHAGPSAIPSWATVRGARLYSRQPVQHGRTFGELCSILSSGPGSREGTLQVSRAGNAGKSLTTPISIRPWQRRHQGDFGRIGQRQPDHFLRGSANEAGMKPRWCNSEIHPGSGP